MYHIKDTLDHIIELNMIINTLRRELADPSITHSRWEAANTEYGTHMHARKQLLERLSDDVTKIESFEELDGLMR